MNLQRIPKIKWDDGPFDEETVRGMSHQLDGHLERMAQPKSVPSFKSLDVELPHRSSSLGRLDDLPPEIRQLILDNLDFRSLATLSAACFMARGVVQAHVRYQDLALHAPAALSVLASSGNLDRFTIAKLHQTLRMEKCAFCADFGPVLFVPTCTRCCFDCYMRHPSLHMHKADHTRALFALSEPEVLSLPSYRSHDPRKEPLYAVVHAREFGLRVYGSKGRMFQVAMDRPERAEERREDFARRLEFYYNETPCQLSEGGEIPKPFVDGHYGDAAVPFAYVPGPCPTPSARVERGLWCCGCDLLALMFSLDDAHDPMPIARDEVFPAGIHGIDAEGAYIAGLRNRAYTRDGLAEHLRKCWVSQVTMQDVRERAEKEAQKESSGVEEVR